MPSNAWIPLHFDIAFPRRLLHCSYSFISLLPMFAAGVTRTMFHFSVFILRKCEDEAEREIEHQMCARKKNERRKFKWLLARHPPQNVQECLPFEWKIVSAFLRARLPLCGCGVWLWNVCWLKNYGRCNTKLEVNSFSGFIARWRTRQYTPNSQTFMHLTRSISFHELHWPT